MFDPVEAVKEFIRYPSISTDSGALEGMRGARKHVMSILETIGFDVETIETPLHPIVIATRAGKAEWPHIIVYGHYDVQPADPLDLWTSPPFEPHIRDGRLYGRGAADNKGPLMVHIAGVARALKERPDLPVRITFLIEGEEEIGSPSFADVLTQHRERLDGDMVLLSDTLSPATDTIAITVGLRGLACLEVELIGPRTDLHSGIHGGAVLNPIQALAELLASLHDGDGRVSVPGFYDDVIFAKGWERDEIGRLSGDAEAYRSFVGVPQFHTLDGLSPAEATRLMPTLEFNGISGGYQGEGSKTIIPSRASAKISCRLVPNQCPALVQDCVMRALQERCSSKVRINVHRGQAADPYRVVPPGQPDTPVDQNQWLARAFACADGAISEVFGKPPIYLREGGSVPIIADLKRVLGMDSLMIGMFTAEDNLHAPDESLHLGMFERGIEVSKRILLGFDS